MVKILSLVENPFLKPAWQSDIRSLLSANSFNLLFIIKVKRFPKQLNKLIGLYFSGFSKEPFFL